MLASFVWLKRAKAFPYIISHFPCDTLKTAETQRHRGAKDVNNVLAWTNPSVHTLL